MISIEETRHNDLAGLSGDIPVENHNRRKEDLYPKFFSKENASKWWFKFKHIGLWVLIIFGAGVYSGVMIEKNMLQVKIDYKVEEAIVLGSFLNEKDGKVYNVTLDPSRSGKKR